MNGKIKHEEDNGSFRNYIPKKNFKIHLPDKRSKSGWLAILEKFDVWIRKIGNLIVQELLNSWFQVSAWQIMDFTLDAKGEVNKS